MAQIFHPAMNVFSKASIFGFVFIIAFVGWVGATLDHVPVSIDHAGLEPHVAAPLPPSVHSTGPAAINPRELLARAHQERL